MARTREINEARPRTVIFFLAPAMLLLAIFLIWPIVQSLRLSLVDWNGIDLTQKSIGLGNWRELAGDAIFRTAIRNSFILVLSSVTVQIPIGLGLAILIDRGSRRFRFFKFAYFFPMLMSTVAVGFLFQQVYDPNFGLLNATFAALGHPEFAPEWLGNTSIAIWAVAAVINWQFIPFYMLIFLAGINGIPEELKEAAALDGATSNVYTRYIQLPLLKGAMATSVMLIVIGSLKYFDLMWVMTGGGPEHSTSVMATYMYEQAFSSQRVGYGSTVASALFFIVFATALVVLRLTRRTREV